MKEVYASYSIDNSTAIFPRPFENLTVVKDFLSAVGKLGIQSLFPAGSEL